MRRALLGLGLGLICSPLVLAPDANARGLRGSTYDHAEQWGGSYIGAHVGGGSGSVSITGAPNSFDLTGVAGGVHLGYNYQFGKFVAGVEGEANILGVSESDSAFGLSATLEATWMASLRARLGVEIGASLLYATAGLAWSQIETDVTGLGFTATASDVMTGAAWGAGLEHKLSQTMIARAEVIHFDFSDQSFSLAGNKIDYDADFTLARAGLSIKLR
jgi:outer membrane immunogenic protein